MSTKIYPVVHFLDQTTACEQVALTRQCGADGVFLISHHGDDDELVDVAWAMKKSHPDFPIGINLLSKSPIEAAKRAVESGLNMVWADDMGVSSKGVSALGTQLQMFKQEHPGLDLFASVAFKYQPYEVNPGTAAIMADMLGFIPTTSGAATGEPPDLEKIRSMSVATHGKLAVASGMTPENVAKYAPYVTHILVATGIGMDEYRIDKSKLLKMMASSQ